MTLLWIDGFDHYGAVGNLDEGVYAAIGASVALSTANPRTGTSHLRLPAAVSGSAGEVRRIFGGAKTTVGTGAVFYFNALPGGNNSCNIFQYRDTANAEQVTIGLQSTGIIAAWNRRPTGGTLLGDSGTPVVSAGAYTHIEVQVLFSNTVGTVEVRVNGVVALSLTGVDTVFTANVEASQVLIGGTIPGENAANTPQMDIDDVFCYDDLGSYNNDFIGDRRVWTLKPNADTVVEDWQVFGATDGFDAINDASQDGDTTYIYTDVVASPFDTSEFGFEDLPDGISAINGIVYVNMMRKTEAGIANVQISTVRSSSADAGTDRAITEVYTYWQDVFEVDPVTSAPFTPDNVDAQLMRIERTA